MQLPELVRRVDSRESFLAFVAALHADLLASHAEEAVTPSSPYGPNAHDWENPSLDLYLEALHSWTEDMGERLPESPSWRTFADILYAAKIYE